jgi:hypothetical protein
MSTFSFKNDILNVRFEVLTSVVMKSSVVYTALEAFPWRQNSSEHFKAIWNLMIYRYI